MDTYDKGNYLERVIAKALRRKGFKVKITPKSSDFGADIIAERNGRRIAIQVKNTKDSVGVKAVQEVMSDAESIHLPGREEVCGKGQRKSPSTQGNPLKKPRGTQ